MNGRGAEVRRRREPTQYRSWKQTFRQDHGRRGARCTDGQRAKVRCNMNDWPDSVRFQPGNIQKSWRSINRKMLHRETNLLVKPHSIQDWRDGTSYIGWAKVQNAQN